MDSAAELLGIGRRTLTDVLKRHQHYERRGVKKVFYPEHIALLREAIECHGLKPKVSRSSASREFGMRMEAWPESALDKALALATTPKPKNSAPNSRPDFGNVLPMVRKQ